MNDNYGRPMNRLITIPIYTFIVLGSIAGLMFVPIALQWLWGVVWG